jgi:hypothetical protein
MKSSAQTPPASSRNITALLLLLGTTSLALATDYSSSVMLDAEASYNDNLRMSKTDKMAVQHYVVRPLLRFNADTETTQFGLSSKLIFNHYDENQFDSNDQDLVLDFQHQFESSAVGLNAALIRDSTITSEVLGSGRIDDTAERTQTYQVTPSYTYTLNETNQLALQATYNAREYDSDNYIGYKNTSAQLDWFHILSDRIKLILSGTYSDYRSDDRTTYVPGQILEVQTVNGPQLLPPTLFGQQTYYNRSKDKGLQIGAEYQWSEQSQLMLRVGRSSNEQTYPIEDDPQRICTDTLYLRLVELGYEVGGVCDLEEDSNLTTVQLNWSWDSERNSISVNSSKATQPSSNGYSVDSTQLSAYWGFKLTERDLVSANVSAVRNRAIGDDAVQQNNSLADRDYQSITMMYRHQFSTNWFVNGSYQYSNQKYRDIDFQSHSNVFTVGIRYQPQEWHWSR